MKIEGKEFDEVWDHLTETAMEKLGISERQAEMRINALRKSGVLSRLGNPDSPSFQIGFDVAMQIPQLGNELKDY